MDHFRSSITQTIASTHSSAKEELPLLEIKLVKELLHGRPNDVANGLELVSVYSKRWGDQVRDWGTGMANTRICSDHAPVFLAISNEIYCCSAHRPCLSVYSGYPNAIMLTAVRPNWLSMEALYEAVLILTSGKYLCLGAFVGDNYVFQPFSAGRIINCRSCGPSATRAPRLLLPGKHTPDHL